VHHKYLLSQLSDWQQKEEREVAAVHINFRSKFSPMTPLFFAKTTLDAFSWG
jgi:hypothetical protein